MDSLAFLSLFYNTAQVHMYIRRVLGCCNCSVWFQWKRLGTKSTVLGLCQNAFESSSQANMRLQQSELPDDVNVFQKSQWFWYRMSPVAFPLKTSKYPCKWFYADHCPFVVHFPERDSTIAFRLNVAENTLKGKSTTFHVDVQSVEAIIFSVCAILTEKVEFPELSCSPSRSCSAYMYQDALHDKKTVLARFSRLLSVASEHFFCLILHSFNGGCFWSARARKSSLNKQGAGSPGVRGERWGVNSL